MATHEKNFASIPAAACVLVVGDFEAGSNGESAKSAPVKLVARSGKPIEHWYWGRIVHDLAGMHMHKSRLPIDYLHDAKEVIGYLNKFDHSTGDLVASGALVPYKDNDRASEIIHKMKEGVPYEASINFGGEGIKVEDVEEGRSVQVNGYNFEGPGVVVREWPLRGVAICPYGADMNTDSSVFSQENKTFAATVVPSHEATTKENAMSDPVEVVATEGTPKPEAVEVKQEEVKVEAPVEAVVAEVVEVVAEQPAVVEAAQKPAEELTPKPVSEQAKIEGAVLAHVEQPAVVPEVKDSRDEFKRMRTDFGVEIAAEVFEQGGDYMAALKLSHDRMKQENETLRKQLSVKPGGKPAQFAASAGLGSDEAKARYAALKDPIERARFREQHASELGIGK